MPEWENYVKRTGACSKCQKAFEEQEVYHATLNESKEGFERRDYCQSCWSDLLRDESFSFWQAKVPKKEERRKLFVDDVVLVDFFKRLMESPDPAKAGFGFVLALILMRKRLLKYVSTTMKDDFEIWNMKLSGDQREYQVPNPHLDDQQIEKIRSELSSVLASE